MSNDRATRDNDQFFPEWGDGNHGLPYIFQSPYPEDKTVRVKHVGELELTEHKKYNLFYLSKGQILCTFGFVITDNTIRCEHLKFYIQCEDVNDAIKLAYLHLKDHVDLTLYQLPY